MAFAVRLEGFQGQVREPSFTLEPCWWPQNQLREDLRFSKSDGKDGYLDYTADLSVAEVRELHERFRANASQGTYDCPDWQKIIQPELAELDLVLGPQADEYSHFRVTVFEWESGLG